MHGKQLYYCLVFFWLIKHTLSSDCQRRQNRRYIELAHFEVWLWINVEHDSLCGNSCGGWGVLYLMVVNNCVTQAQLEYITTNVLFCNYETNLTQTVF